MTKPLALVTGGSSGIGLELALLLAKDGHDLVISGFSDRVQHAASEHRSLGAEVIAFSSDLTTAEGNEVVIKVVRDTERPLKIAVLNAGISIGGTFLEIPPERHLDLISLDVISPVRLTYALLPGMIESGGGKCLFVSSLSATTPTPYETVYGSSKAFLSSFGHSLREELVGTNVGITILQPGATATAFHAKAGMGSTAFADNNWKNDPALVARQGYHALLTGETCVIGGDEATREAARLNKVLSEKEKAHRHAMLARPH